jgi:hypothetical protein
VPTRIRGGEFIIVTTTGSEKLLLQSSIGDFYTEAAQKSKLSPFLLSGQNLESF